jgi:hypothetical protein
MPDLHPVDQFISRATTALGDQPREDPNAPLVPFPSALRLTREQEKNMIEWAFLQMEHLEQENGRDQTMNPTWWMNLAPAPNLMLASQGLLPANTFLGKRSRFDATFYNDVSWRPWTMGPDNIFMTSNLVVPLARRIARQMIAKAYARVFGPDDTVPWFSVGPKPEPSSQLDDATARAIERFCRYKLKETNSKDDKKSAIRRAMVLGECVVKTSYVVRDQLFDCEAMVLHNIEGSPVLDTRGNPVRQDAKFVDAEDGTGRKVLEDDGETELPESPIWQKVSLKNRQVLFEGAKSEPIYYKDFLAPLTATDLQSCECCIHLYDKTVMEFIDLVVKRGMVSNTEDGRKDAVGRMVALVKRLAENTPAPKSAQNAELRPNENFSPIPGQERNGPQAEFAEFYMWYDANEDGVAENIMLICDRRNHVPVLYDHVANVTTDGLRPLEVVRINPVEARWYGQGVIELFESYQTVVDLMTNRWNFSQSRSGRVDLWNPTNTVEGDRDPNLKMNWGGTYTKKPGMKKEDILETVYLTDTKFEQIHEMVQFFMQLAMNESGVTNANDDQAAGMQSSKLATGIINVQQTGDELFEPMLDDILTAAHKVLNREIDVTLSNINPQEAYSYLEGDKEKIGTLTPDDVRGLKFKVTIDLTTHKNQLQLQAAAQASALVEKFYALPPEIQARVVSFYRTQLRALEPHADVNTVLSPMPPAPPTPPPQPLKATLAVSAKLGELTPEERIQVLGDIGVHSDGTIPVPPEAQKSPNGKTAKPGEAGPAGSTPFPTQLSQTSRVAPGG